MPQQIGVEGVFDLGNFSKGLAGYTGGLGKAEGATNKFTKSVGKGWTDLGSVATKASLIMGGAVVAGAAAAGAAIVGFTVGGIQKAMNLEEQMSRIAATLNMTVEQAKPLKGLITDLGLDPNLKVSATEAAQAIENLAKNGLSMEQIMDGAARATVLLANATGADFGMAADIATDVMAQFNKGADEMMEVVDGITAVTNLSKFTIDDYALAIGQAGGVAAQFGVSFDDFNAVLVATSASFASGSDAGTSYKNFLTRLAPSTKEAQQAVRELGLEFFDSNGAMKSQAEIAEELNKAFFQEVTFSKEVSGATAEQTAQRKMLEKTISSTNAELYKYQVGINGVAQSEADKAVSIDRLNRQHAAAVEAYNNLAVAQGTTVTSTHQLTEKEKILYAQTIFGTDAMRTAFGMAEAGVVVYSDAATAAHELGVSQAEVNKVIEGGVTQFEALQLQMEAVDAEKQAAIRMQNFKGVLEILGGVVEAVQIQIGDFFLPVLTEVATKFTELASQYGPIVTAFFETLAADITDLVHYFGELITTGEPFNQFFADLSPTVQAVVLGVGAFVVGVQAAYDLIASSIGRFVEWNDVLVVLGAAIATTVIPAIWGMVAAMAPMLLVFGAAVLAVAAVRTAWEENFLGIQDATLAAISAIQVAFQPLMTAIQEFGQGALAEIRAFVTGNETEFTNLATIWDGARESMGNLFASLNTFLTENIPAWGAISAALSAVVGVYVEQLKLIFDTAVAAWTQTVALVTALINGDWAGAWTAAGSLAQTGVDFIVGTLTNLQTLVQPVWDALSAAASQWIADAIPIVQQKLGEWWAAIQGYIVDNLPVLQGVLLSWGQAAWQWIADAAARVPGKLSEWWAAIQNFVSTNQPAWQATLESWATAAWQWIIDAAGQVAGKLGQWWTAIQNYVTTNLPAWKNTLTEWATAAWNWIIDAAGQVATKLSTWVAALTSYVASQLPTWKAKLLEWTTAAWDWIGKAVAPMLTAIAAFATSLISAISARLPGWIAAFTAWATGAWQWIEKTIPTTVAQIGVWATRVISSVSEKLPDWIAGFQKWAAGMVVWIAPVAAQAATAIAKWAGELVGHVAANLPKWIAGFLEFATAMVDWILDKAADALPHLGTWLGKLLGWATLVAIALTVATVKWGIALVSWVVTDAIPGIGPNLGKFLAEFISGLGAIFLALGVATKNFAVAWWETVVTGIKEALGIASPSKVFMDIGISLVQGVIEGLSAMTSALLTVFGAIVTGLVALITEMDWANLGSDLVSAIKNGVADMASDLIGRMGQLAKDAADKFINFDWAELGESLIEGIIQGMKDNAQDVFDYLVGLAQDAFGAFADAIGFGSPAKEFIPLGESIIQGLMVGIEQTASNLYRAIDRITGRILSTVRQANESAVSLFSGLAGDFLSASSPFVERAQARGGGPAAQGQALADYNRIQQTYDLLKSQADLIETIRDSGGDVAGLLAGMRLGRDADPALILKMVNKASEQFVANLERSIQVASRGYDRIVDNLRDQRKTVEEIEADFQAQHLTGLDAFKQRILDIDQRILDAENDLLTYGGSERVAVLNQLHQFRQRTVADMTRYLEQWRLLNLKLERIQTSDNGRAQAAIDQFRATMIDPLVTQFQNPMTDASGRDSLLRTIDQRNRAIDTYLANLDSVADIESRFAAFGDSEDLGERFKRTAKVFTDALYNVGLVGRDFVLDETEKWLDTAERAFELFNSVAGDDPLLAKIKDSVKPILENLLDVGLPGNLRTQFMRDLNKTISDMMAIEHNQGQINAIQERLDLVERVRKLGTDLKDFNLFGRVFRDIDLTKDLSSQDLAKALGRYTNEAIRLANQQLTEAIRPRVDVQSQLDLLRRKRETFEQIADDFLPNPFSQTTQFQEALAWYDTELARLEQQALETGSQATLDRIRAISEDRQMIVDQTRMYLRQVYQADQSLKNVRTTTSQAGQAAADAFKAKFIDPMLAQMDSFGSAATRRELITRISGQVDALNLFIHRINQLEAVQNRRSPTGPMETMLERFFNVSTSDADRQAVIRYIERVEQLEALQKRMEPPATPMDTMLERFFGVDTSDQDRQSILRFVGQVKTLQDAQKDIADGLGVNPLVGRFQTDVLDRILDRFYDLNTSEAERLQLIQQYRQEQEKIVALQSKQQQLTFLKDQLSLLDEIKSLNEEFGEQVALSDILAGIEFGVNASMDDMLTLTSRAIDAMIRVTKEQLGISSPSKVFAKIGEYMMQGLGQGITNAAQYPAMAMANVNHQVPYSITNNRSAVVNQYIGNINSGMDERTFDARVRRVLREEFA